MRDGDALDRPTILIVGEGERMQAALEQALLRHDIEVESVPLGAIGDAAFAAAPDLLLLIGNAANDAGEAALKALELHAGTSTVPVAVLAREGVLEQPHEEFRHGIVAVVRRTASADGMAREIAALARDVPQRSGEIGGELGEDQVDELIALFNQQLRTGILSVSAEGEDAASTQVVLRAGRSAGDAIAELVERMRPLLERNKGPLRYEFHESPAERLDLLDVAPDGKGPEPDAFTDVRVLLVEQNPARADVLVQELRTAGALVVVADGRGRGLERARTHDPDLVIIDGSGMESWATDALRHLRRDPRLRWASLLVVDAEELWSDGAGRPSLKKLTRSVHSMLRPDRDMTARASAEERFETRLELIGPVRMLRALVRAGVGLRLITRHPRARIEIDLAEGLVVGAQAFSPKTNEEIGEGPAAIAALLALGSGRVRVERREAPATANLMSPLDDALAAAAQERSPVSPSLPPPTPAYGMNRPSSAPPSGSRDAEKLLARLEDLLERLGDVLPSADAEDEPAPTRGRVPRPGGVMPVAKKAIPPPRRELTKSPKARTAPPPKRVGLAQTRRAPLSAPPGPASSRPSTAPPRERPASLRPSVAPAVRPPWQRPSAPPSEPEDEDIPVIEATAEPGELARGGGASSEGSVPPLEPDVPVIEAFAAPSVAPPPPPPPPNDVGLKQTLAMDAVPLAPPPPPIPAYAAVAVPEEEAVQLPSSRLPLLLGAAAVVGLLVLGGGGLVAWLAFSEDPVEPTATLPGTAVDPTPTQVTPRTPPRSTVLEAAPPGTGAPTVADPAPAVEAAVEEPAIEAAVEAPAVEEPADAVEEPADAIEEDPEDEAPADDPEDEAPTADDPEDEAPAPTGSSAERRREEEIAHELRSGNFDRNQGRLREAEVHYLRVLRLQARNRRALAGLARLALARHDGTQAVRWASRLASAAPRNPNNLVLLGDAYRAAGQRDAATRAYRQALEVSPGHANATRRLRGQ
ncbi:MAG: hypothetical protein H6719_33165 [Sandaracinaceae bacterium]|nr:hypothetical protein [Sandaracinaceae bacterium]